MDPTPFPTSLISKVQSVASSVFGALFSRRHLAPTPLEVTRRTIASSFWSASAVQSSRRVAAPVNHQPHQYPSSSSKDNPSSKEASSHCCSLPTCSAMDTPYSFADNGPIPEGDPFPDAQPVNVSKTIAPHRRAKRTERERAARVGQTNPPQEQPAHPVISTNDLSQLFKPRHEDGSVVRMEEMPSLARRADQALLEYLQKRRITSHFLNEIDDFLKSYPELLKACPNWCYQLATLPPLDAYMYFVRGYLRPARYVDGALPSLDRLKVPDRPVYLEHTVFDAELFEFFADIGVCYEILGDMDKEVALLTQDYLSGRQLNRHQLIYLAMFTYANPVDALKYYEYFYKTKLQQNRRVGEHNILSHLARFDPMPAPRPARRAPRSAPGPNSRFAPRHAPRFARRCAPTQAHREGPRPSQNYQNRRRPVRDQPNGLKASGVEIMRSFGKTRNAMAKASDRGDDVVSVLIDCFAETVQSRSAKRPSRDESNRLCQVAFEVLEREYMTGGKRDIVELVMMLAPEARYGRAPSHFHPYINNPTGAFYGIRSRYVRSAAKQVKVLYEKEAKMGSQGSHSLALSVKKAEYRLTDLIGWYARLDGSMNKEEYDFLRKVFPHRKFEDVAEYEQINPGGLDVLLLLEKWI